MVTGSSIPLLASLTSTFGAGDAQAVEPIYRFLPQFDYPVVEPAAIAA